MAITVFDKLIIPPIFPFGSWPPTFSTKTINNTNDKIGFVIQVPKTGTLHSFEWRTGAVTNNPDNGLRMSFQDISATTGFPDGVADQFRNLTGVIAADTWQIPPGPITSDGTDTGTKRSVTRGQWLGCVIEFVTFVAGDSVVINDIGTGTQTFNSWVGYIADGNTGTYAKNVNCPLLALKYDDGTYAFLSFTYPASAAASTVFGSGSTPDERALRFKLPVKSRLSGVWAQIDADNACDVVLYDSVDAVVKSISLDSDIRGSTGAAQAMLLFDADVDLEADEVYRLAAKPTTAATVALNEFTVPSNAYLAATYGGIEWYLSTRTDAGAWTDTDNQRPMMGLILGGFEGGSAGGAFVF